MKSRKIQILFLICVLLACKELDVPQSANELSMIDTHISLNEDDFVLRDVSGVRVVIHEFGQLPPAGANDRIKVRVIGTVLKDNNRFFDEEFETTLSDLETEGLKLGVSLLMGESIATIYVPSKLAFGETGKDGVPPNSIIKYNVALLRVYRNAQQQTQFEQDTSKIIAFLKRNNIKTEAHVSGIYYKIDKMGDGVPVNVYASVSGDIKESLLEAAIPYRTTSLANSRVFDLIDGLKVGLPIMKNDGWATFYIPSSLAYGSSVQESFPANSIIKVNVKLSPVVK